MRQRVSTSSACLPGSVCKHSQLLLPCAWCGVGGAARHFCYAMPAGVSVDGGEGARRHPTSRTTTDGRTGRIADGRSGRITPNYPTPHSALCPFQLPPPPPGHAPPRRGAPLRASSAARPRSCTTARAWSSALVAARTTAHLPRSRASGATVTRKALMKAARKAF